MQTDQTKSKNDEGVTLVELLVYMVSASVVLLSIVGIVSSIFTVNGSVQTSLVRSNQLQTTFKSLQLGIRNSAALQLTTLSNGQLLVAKVYSVKNGNYSSTDDTCQAWLYNKTLGTGLYTAFFTARAQMPNPNVLTGWISLTDTVVPSNNTAPVLSLNPQGVVTLRYSSITRDDVNSFETMTSKPRMPNGLVTGSCFN